MGKKSKNATPPAAAAIPATPEAKQGQALSREDIVAKLSVVPMFVLLNALDQFVSVKSEGGETCFWHSSAATARHQLLRAKEQNPDIAGLKMGVQPLGLAYSLGANWQSGPSCVGEVRLGDDGPNDGSAPALRHTLVLEQGLPAECPVFLCEKLQTPMEVRLPVLG
mgnify:CR=1 FL=1